jgi:hypothetical protein
MRDWTKRQWAIAGGVLVAVLVIVGIGFAVTGGGDDDVVASTTSTTKATTTTTEPPPTFPLTGLPPRIRRSPLALHSW